MGLNRRGGTWDGGYVSLGRGGRKTYVIERSVRGVRFHVSTRCHTESGAYQQLRRFEADPLAYRPEGEPVAGLYITAELGTEFYDWQVAKGVTRQWARTCARLLAAWAIDLEGVDLRRLNLQRDVYPALERRATSRQHRVEALKAFCSWLRKRKGLLTQTEDATLNLPVPQGRPEKWVRRKAVAFADVQRVLVHLSPLHRDVLALLAHTGLHVTEVERFVRLDASELVRQSRGDTLAVLVTRHKSGKQTRTAIRDAGVLEAAERLRARRGLPPRSRLNGALREACRAAGVAEFTFGVLRHSVATWAIEAGNDPRAVSELLGHEDPRTVARFYADVSVPTSAVTLPKLRLVKG